VSTGKTHKRQTLADANHQRRQTDRADPLPLFEQDEALSSAEVKERMRESARYNFKVDLRKIDELAASIISEDFMSENQR